MSSSRFYYVSQNVQQHSAGNASVVHPQAQHQNIAPPAVVVQQQKNNLVNSSIPPNEYNVVMNHQQASHQHGGLMSHSSYRGHPPSKYHCQMWIDLISQTTYPYLCSICRWSICRLTSSYPQGNTSRSTYPSYFRVNSASIPIFAILSGQFWINSIQLV